VIETRFGLENKKDYENNENFILTHNNFGWNFLRKIFIKEISFELEYYKRDFD